MSKDLLRAVVVTLAIATTAALGTASASAANAHTVVTAAEAGDPIWGAAPADGEGDPIWG
ncbi:hypothetical protein [Streptomyces avermitilis]|uniref:hypothetical protein n=1 Tax=Streptomyces avermitilis TaxID=33903 RepID=UPI0033B949E8